MLIEIKKYFTAVPKASIVDVAQFLNTNPKQIQHLIDHWEMKGKLQKISCNSSCAKSCNMCSPILLQYYCWNK